MEKIILALISGLFSLVGIWYQNYLHRQSNIDTVNSRLVGKSAKRSKDEPLAHTHNEKSGLRIFFTILITTLPWLIWKFLTFRLNSVGYKYLDTYAKIMLLYFFIWLVVTIFTILIAWKLKTFFEKLILIVSSTLLLYWIVWMVVVHHLL